jgi:hypothetical protein
MKRPSIASQNVRVLVAATALAVGAIGCGSGGGGSTGGGGSNGGGGTSGTTCDAMPIFTTYGCAIPACHSATGPAANFDMQTAGWETKLIGKAPPGGGPPGADGGASLTASMCANMAKVYLVAGSNPATGLFIDKLFLLHPECGARMPNIGGPLTTKELTCVQQWATALTTK